MIEPDETYEPFEMPEPTRLMVAGDWHGNTRYAEKAIRHAKKGGCDAIVHLGDFGYWPRFDEGPRFYKVVVEELRHRGLRLYWVDGNHENHDLLNPGMGNEVIQHLPRGHRWEWWGKTWMAIGGGVSVDKQWRRPHIDWFPEETLTPRQFEYCLREGGVDIVVAHDAPEESSIPGIHAKEKLGLEPSLFPDEQIRESWEHRALMSEICKDKHPSHWFHGHYHHRYNDTVMFGDDPCQVVGLDMDGTHLNWNTVILTAKDVEPWIINPCVPG